MGHLHEIRVKLLCRDGLQHPVPRLLAQIPHEEDPLPLRVHPEYHGGIVDHVQWNRLPLRHMEHADLHGIYQEALPLLQPVAEVRMGRRESIELLRGAGVRAPREVVGLIEFVGQEMAVNTFYFQRMGPGENLQKRIHMIQMGMGQQPDLHSGLRPAQRNQFLQQVSGILPVPSVDDHKLPCPGLENVGHHLGGALFMEHVQCRPHGSLSSCFPPSSGPHRSFPPMPLKADVIFRRSPSQGIRFGIILPLYGENCKRFSNI